MDCLICLDRFNSNSKKPMVLDCGHTFCLSCVQKIYLTPKPECPLDRSKLKKCLKEVSVNYLVQDIISSLSSFSISSPVKEDPQTQPKDQAVESEPIAPATELESIQARAENPPLNTAFKCPEGHAIVEFEDIPTRLSQRSLKNRFFCDFAKVIEQHESGLV